MRAGKREGRGKGEREGRKKISVEGTKRNEQEVVEEEWKGRRKEE